jgi:two-component system, cell cycle response regulator
MRRPARSLALQDELVAERNLFQSKAERDPLTRLWNHAEIFRVLGRELIRGARENRPVGLIIGDVDRFKTINDTFGHLAGDTVVRAVAETMTALLRPYDGIGRYGGDEFLVVLPGCDAEQSALLAERLRAAIASRPVDTPDGLVPVAMSLGVTACQACGAVTPESLVRAADTALYRAKRNGANRVEVAASGAVGTRAPIAQA